MRGVVVGNQTQRPVLLCFAVYLLEELQPLQMRVALRALAGHLTIQYIERGE